MYFRCTTLACVRAILKALGGRSEGTHCCCTPALRFDIGSRDVIDSTRLLFRESRRAMLAVREDATWEVLGTSSAAEQETLDVLMVRESITSVELSPLRGNKLNARARA